MKDLGVSGLAVLGGLGGLGVVSVCLRLGARASPVRV